MPKLKLFYRLIKAGGKTVVCFDDGLDHIFYLDRANLLERIANLTAQGIECSVELDALAELQQAEKEEQTP